LLIFNFQKLTTSADRTPEEAKIRSLLNKRKLEEAAAKSIQDEFIEFKEKTTAAINKEITVKMRSILNALIAKIAKYATAKGFDLVFDVSGFSNTGLPVILYAKPGNTTDITDELINLLCPKTEKAAPKEAAPVVPNP
jgi:Skp family chaperone for outer membrane proteins